MVATIEVRHDETPNGGNAGGAAGKAEFATIRLTVEDRIGRLTFGRPEHLNAINDTMHGELRTALDAVEASSARVLVISGAGRAFCAGQDLGDRKPLPEGRTRDLGDSIEQRYNPLIRRLQALRMPTIAAVNGAAAGAGAAIALAVDLCVASENARFVQAFTRIGLVPDCGATWQLTQRVGQARALGLALLADPIEASVAADWGLIWKAVPAESLEAEVEALARRLADGPPVALIATRHAIRRAAAVPFDDQLDHERDLQRTLGFTRDYAEGVAAFAAKRPPAFTGD